MVVAGTQGGVLARQAQETRARAGATPAGTPSATPAASPPAPARPSATATPTPGSTPPGTATPTAMLATPAASPRANVRIQPAGVTLSETVLGAPTFAVVLSGTDSVVSYALPISVSDLRGTGAGRNLTVSATTWTSGSATLPATASSVTAVTAACSGGVCTAPINSVTYPFVLPAAVSPPAAVKLFNAAASSGTGQFTITPTVHVTVPANARSGAYTSTITLAIASGP